MNRKDKNKQDLMEQLEPHRVDFCITQDGEDSSMFIQQNLAKNAHSVENRHD